MNAVDPEGEAVGHHYVPNVVRRQFKSKIPEVHSVFDKSTTGPTDPKHGNSTDHVEYNLAVDKESGKFLSCKEKAAGEITADDAREFLQQIKTSTEPVIADFLKKVQSQLIKYATNVSDSVSDLGESVRGMTEGASDVLGVYGAGLDFWENWPEYAIGVDPNDPAAQKAFNQWMKDNPNDPFTWWNQQPVPMAKSQGSHRKEVVRMHIRRNS